MQEQDKSEKLNILNILIFLFPPFLAILAVLFLYSRLWEGFWFVLGMAILAIPAALAVKLMQKPESGDEKAIEPCHRCKVDPAFLLKHSFFGGLTGEDAASIGSLFEYDEWAEGAYIMTEGTPGSRVYFIMEGTVEVVKKEERLATFKAGDIVGEMEFLDVMPAAASVRALTRVKTAALTGRALHSVYKRNPQAFSFLMMNLARDLSRRLRKMDELLTEGN